MPPYIESPLERIVDVHFGGTVVVAELPYRFAALSVLEPPDPDGMLNWQGIYDEGVTIPRNDYTSRSITTTADLTVGARAIDNIADVSLLNAGRSYAITGPGIPASARMTYAGGRNGTLTQPATASGVTVPVTIQIPILLFRSIVRLLSGINAGQTWSFAMFRSEPLDRGADGYFNSINVLYFGEGEESGQNTAHEQLLAGGMPEDWMLLRHYQTPETYNGTLLPFPWGIYQIKGIEGEPSYVYLINMDTAKLVRIDQLSYPAPYHAGQTGNFIPGWLESGGGTKLTAYSAGTQLSLSGGPRPDDAVSLSVIAKRNDAPATPVWSVTLPPTGTPPSDTVELARFNANGLL